MSLCFSKYYYHSKTKKIRNFSLYVLNILENYENMNILNLCSNIAEFLVLNLSNRMYNIPVQIVPDFSVCVFFLSEISSLSFNAKENST